MAMADYWQPAPLSKKHTKSSKQSIEQGLHPLHTPNDFDKDPKCVDIIAVPGLGSDMTFTWVSKGVHWLRDEPMLQNAVPKARISVFGYRSQWYGQDAVEIRLSTISRDLLDAIKTDRRDSKNKKRPIIFIGHSLGGLVVSKAVTTAKREADSFRGIIDCITACVFLGTPFRGSTAQPLAKVIGMAGSVVGKASDNELIRTLKPDSRELVELADEFLGDVGKVQIDVVCYFELEKTNGMVIADEKTSTFEGKPRYSWARTHSQMNKFDGPKDSHYRQLSGTLREFANQSHKKIKLRQEAVKREIVDDAHVENVLDALEVSNPKKDLETIRRSRGIGKGMASSWIQQSQQYLSWRDNESSHNVWICGGAGKGKTMAAMAMVEDLSRIAGPESDSAVLGHFFCDEHDRDKSNALNVLKSLAWQLLRVRKDLARHFFGEENISKGAVQRGDAEYEFESLSKVWKCLQAALSDPSVGTVFFVVNSLDQIEAESRKQLLSRITSFRPAVSDEDNPSGPFVKWLFLSSHRDDIQDSFREATILNLDDGSHLAKQDDDLRTYVNRKIDQIASAKDYSRPLTYFIKSYICLQARGKSNYDWVNLVCLELESAELPLSVVRPRLEELPTDLFPMYDQVASRVLKGSDLELEYSKDILRCLLLTHYPPTLEELAVIAGLPKEDWGNRKELKKHVVRCGALTTMFKDGQDIKVQLSHPSVREFLKSKANDWISMGSEYIQHGVIALQCFDYVLSVVKNDEEIENQQTEQSDTEDEPDQTSNVDQEEENSGDDFADVENDEDSESENTPDDDEDAGEKDVLRYPITQWIEHALEATADIVESFDIANVFWVLGSKQRAEWSRAYTRCNPDLGDEGPGFDEQFTAMHVAAYFGYLPLADLLLKSNLHDEEIKATDSQGLQPLYWACRRGHMNMAQKLYEVDKTGDSINYQQTEDHATALHGAIESGNSEIVAYMLNHGAEVNRPNKRIGSALYLASSKGFIGIVQQLLDRQADPNLLGGGQVTALSAAVDSTDLNIVKLLVKHGAELNPSVEYNNGNALGAACYWGEHDIAEYLLENGCDYTKLDCDGILPIEVAAEEGFTSIVQLLLRYDRSLESHEKALLKATDKGREDVVALLVAHSPNVPRGDAFYNAASKGHAGIVKILTWIGVDLKLLEQSLYVAVDYQYEETVQALLEMGIDANAEGEEYGNALQASAYDGTTGILKMLLDRKADPNRVYPNSEYGTALQAACYEGTLENVQILINNGASVNPEVSGYYGTPLQAACAQGYTEIVKFLLEHGANPNTNGGHYGYAMIAACDGGGDDDMLNYLIARGVDVNSRSPDGDTPLTNAAMELPKSCLEILISHGAYIHSEDGDNDTALTNAAVSGDEETVRYLLELGLDVHHCGKWGSALYRATTRKSVDCMKTLLEHGADVNQNGGELYTPLQVAAHYGEMELVELLCNHGADIKAVGGKYHTALQAAVGAGSIEVAQRLLDSGADPNENGGEYGSALHSAVYADEPIPLIDLLLQHGAEINAVDERGTPLQLATAVANIDVTSHLLENGAQHDIVTGKYGTALQAACFMYDNPNIRELADRGADPFLQGGYYQNAFIAAAANGLDAYVREWLPTVPESWILVEALHYAIHFRERDVVEALLDHGVNVNISSSLYKSAMEALEADITDAERKQQGGDLDFWYHDHGAEEDEEADEDGDGDGDDEDEDEDGDSQNDEDDDDESENSEDDDDESEDSEDDDGDGKAEAEAQAALEIKAMLEKVLIETSPQDQNQGGQSEHYTGIRRKPLPSREDLTPIPTTHPNRPVDVVPQQDIGQEPHAIPNQNVHAKYQAGYTGNFNHNGYNGSHRQNNGGPAPWASPPTANMQQANYQQNTGNSWASPASNMQHGKHQQNTGSSGSSWASLPAQIQQGRSKFGFKGAFKNFMDDVL